MFLNCKNVKVKRKKRSSFLVDYSGTYTVYRSSYIKQYLIFHVHQMEMD